LGLKIPQSRYLQEQISIDIKDITKGVKISSGSTAIVFEGTYHYSKVALKYMMHVDGNNIKDFQTEVSMMANLRHPCIIQFHGACFDPNKPFLVMDYMPFTLSDFLQKSDKRADWKIKYLIAMDISSGLSSSRCSFNVPVDQLKFSFARMESKPVV